MKKTIILIWTFGWTNFFFVYLFIHMCIHCLGHFSPLPPRPPQAWMNQLLTRKTIKKIFLVIEAIALEFINRFLKWSWYWKQGRWARVAGRKPRGAAVHQRLPTPSSHFAFVGVRVSHWLLELLPSDSTIKTGVTLYFLLRSCLTTVTSIHATKVWGSLHPPTQLSLWKHLTRL
jgi:hypothetical protein